jgi:hypothetical protein
VLLALFPKVSSGSHDTGFTFVAAAVAAAATVLADTNDCERDGNLEFFVSETPLTLSFKLAAVAVVDGCTLIIMMVSPSDSYDV